MATPNYSLQKITIETHKITPENKQEHKIHKSLLLPDSTCFKRKDKHDNVLYSTKKV